MSDPEFLEADVVLFLHDQALREYGGIQGVKDEGMLHSALGRPGNKLAYAVSIGTELGPQIGTQKGPSCEVC
ncbi:hypothetical protein ROTAS13_04557 [Roseomonas sp. TAS13]|uniref:hypothetical protein n=1 Tax=Roseomonas sp. TAS13 TaxID=1926319 RepID=UPI00095EA715|nr:hypothetical protein ROTAS13_04557 [Roseomonas sp. TAS13]